MKFQLELQQSGYFYKDKGNTITEKWNNMIMTLQCCGVNYYNDTYDTKGKEFCCKNAHPSILDSNTSSTHASELLDNYFGGCGGYKTETCADAILFKTRMFVGWFLAFAFLQIVLEIIGIIFVNKEYSVIMLTERTEKSLEALNSKSILFRKIFRGVKLFCVSNCKRKREDAKQEKCLRSPPTAMGKKSRAVSRTGGQRGQRGQNEEIPKKKDGAGRKRTDKKTQGIFNLAVLCLAINIRFDKVFGNSDIQELFSEINISNHTFTSAINTFSIVTVTFSSLSIAVVIFSYVVMAIPKWKSILSFVTAVLLCFVAVANIIQEGLWVTFIINESSDLRDELMNQFSSSGTSGYHYSDYSGHYDSELSLSWNTLFVQAECCGVGLMNAMSFFYDTSWYNFPSDNFIPVQCCISQTDVFPYSTKEDRNCTQVSLTQEGYFHSESCDDAVKHRLGVYSLIFNVLMAIIIFAEICCIVTTVLNAKRFKQEATILNRSIKTSEEDAEIRKDDKTPIVNDNVKKERKHGDKEGQGSSRNKRQSSVGTVDKHQKANTIVQDNAEENIELHMMKSMETEATIDNKPDTSTNKRRQKEDELAKKGLTLPDN
ncbi:uncharacterized protein LOC143084305 [Mytilus galloprovincialis]|uniref:uncharacterized protein LOC143084305 n=1 Tax=Mytilus galloprovincialis TaxID=29158 RepID=UPI003F7C2097